MAKHPKSERESPWFKYGTDKDYQAFCRAQPSALSGQTNNIVYAHYRTAQNAGTGYKPPFSGVPLTVDEHYRQHQYGVYTFAPSEWWEYQCALHLERWRNSLLTGSAEGDI